MGRCPICDSSQCRILGPHPDFAGHAIAQCLSCKMISIDPVPSMDQLSGLYPETYRGAIDERPSDDYLKFMDQRGLAQRAFIAAHHRVDAASRVLDIGCSAGSLLKAFGEDTAHLEGYEPDVMMAGVARDRLPTSARIFNEMCDPALLSANAYDLITLSHVFEHVVEPVAFLGRLLRAIRPNGLVFIEVPNESTSEVMRQIRAPLRGKLHLSYFNPRTLERCVARAGGTTVSISTYGPTARRFSIVADEMLRRRTGRNLVARACSHIRSALLAKRSPRWVGTVDLTKHLGRENGRGGIWIRALISKRG